MVTPEDLEETMAAGPDPEVHHKFIRGYIDAGVQRLALSYPGEDFDGFFDFWRNELRPSLRGSNGETR
jgi:hypothetical protein